MRLGLGLSLRKYRKVGSLLKKLIKNCGLDSYGKGVTSGQIIDKTGNHDESILAKEIVGDGVTYLEVSSAINLGTSHTITFKGEYKNLTEILIGEKTSTDMFIATISTSNTIQYRVGGGALSFALTDTTSVKELKFVRDNLNVELFKDGVSLGTQILDANNDFIIDRFFADSRTSINFTGKLYSSIFEKGSNTYTLINESYEPSTNQYTMKVSDGTRLTVQQFNVPATPLNDTLEVESDADKNGYTVADGTQYKDPSLTTLYPVGTIIPSDGTLDYAYVTGGVRPATQNPGEVRKNFDVVDGVVNNGVDYENWQIIAGDESQITISTNGITYNGDGTFNNAQVPFNIAKTGVKYTVVFDVVSTTVLSGNKFSINVNSGFANPDVSTVGEKRALTTTTAGGFLFTRIFMRDSALAGENVTIENIRVYEGDYVTGSPTLPTGYVSGNSISPNQPYYFEGDTNEVLVDKTNFTPKVLPYDDTNNITDNFLMINKDEPSVTTYKSALTEPCYTDALKLSKLNEGLFDSEGSALFDSDGSRLYALKEGVTTNGNN